MTSCFYMLLLFALPISLFALPTDHPKVVILLGAPASGKGTQAVRLAEELKIPHISTGDLFRDNIRQGTDLGKKVKAIIDSGKLVSDDIVLDMLFDRLKKPDAAKGFVLDGVPRTIPQAEELERRLPADMKLYVLNLDVSDDVIIKRTAGRMSCKACGNVQNKYFSPPKVENVCDKCGGELTSRKDDAPEIVTERLRAYHEQTEPVVEYYKKKGLLKNVHGEQAPDAVFNDLKKAIAE